MMRDLVESGYGTLENVKEMNVVEGTTILYLKNVGTVEDKINEFLDS